MQIDYALILSAGLGTRMGEIGKVIPKVLWPVYFKTLLELQILYCQELGVSKIYINTHYLHDEIIVFLKSRGLDQLVHVLHEDPLLDSGGAVHNLASRKEINYKGNVLLVNGDQFLFIDSHLYKKALEKLQKSRAVLFGIKVDKNSNYNETVTSSDRLVEIKKNDKKDHDYVTYSGLGLLRLDDLTPVPGISRFFESVTDFKKEVVEMLTPASFEYWDFGTAAIYAENILKLSPAEHQESAMFHFLKRNGGLEGDVSRYLDGKIRSIDLECSGHFRENCLYARGLYQNI